MSRQQAFEAIYAKQHDVPAESLVQYRFESKEGYSLPGIASHYRFYCLAMDSIVVELPKDYPMSATPKYQSQRQETIRECQQAITAAGVKYK